MAIRAQSSRSSGQHLVVGFFDGVIAMAFTAFRPAMFIEGLLVFAAIEEARVCGMALAATSTHARHAGRRGSVIAMAIVACRCTEITALKQSAAMNTGAKLGQLRRGQGRAVRARDPGHCLRIRVACAASFRDSLREHFRLRIFRGANPVYTVATHAGGSAIVVFVQ